MDLEALYSRGEDAYFAGLPDKAEPLLRQAAEAGHAGAACRLGRLHDAAGHKDQAIRWYGAAAERGDTEAMINLAILIEADDRETALDWTRRAVELGAERTAHYNLGVFLEEDGLLEEAEHYYREAAQAAYPAARNRLACLLKKAGRMAEAEEWYRRALDERADSCDTPGDDDYAANTAIMYNLAMLLDETSRPHEALALFRHAARRGDTDAAQEAVRLESTR